MKKFARAMALGVSLFVCANTWAQDESYRWDSDDESSRRYIMSLDQKVESILSNMTLEEKIGQMTQAERANVKSGEVKKYFLGSLLSGGGSVPQPNAAEAWAGMYNGFQAEALSTRLRIPLIYGVDAVHGHNNVYGATIFPHNIGLGATRDPFLMKKIGEATAEEILATGVTWTFAPCVAVTRDDRWGRTYESFGETPELQNLLVSPMIRGLQGAGRRLTGVVATAKHYVGDGGTTWAPKPSGGYPIDRGDTVVDEATLRAIHLPGYVKALEADVGTVMVSYSSWNGLKMHQNRYLITDVLKKELGFSGFVITDWDAIDELPGTYYDQIVASANAGIDMFMIPGKWKEFIAKLKQAVRSGDVSTSRIDDAVRRILRVKLKFGLFARPYADVTPGRSSLGSPEHREIARQAVRESLVLLKNTNSALPLKKNAKIFLAGQVADNLGYQCGGWTLTWQGGSGETTVGTTIAQGLQNVALKYGGSIKKIESIKNNLALGKPVTASSVEGTLVAANAVDGDTSSRWSTDFSDPQWIAVDLGSVQNVSKIVLNWEPAYAKEYKIQFSNDGANWSDAAHVTTGDGGIDEVSLAGQARYVRMLGLQRATVYGYSLYEFEVYDQATADDAIAEQARGCDVAVVVVGETPYAEGLGDNATLTLNKADTDVIEALAKAKIPLVVVTVSGRPLMIADLLGKANAFVQAWLPGTEGQGVADVLYGFYDFRGKLPVTWPWSVDQIPINAGDANYAPLFAYGYGMSYKDKYVEPKKP